MNHKDKGVITGGMCGLQFHENSLIVNRLFFWQVAPCCTAQNASPRGLRLHPTEGCMLYSFGSALVPKCSLAPSCLDLPLPLFPFAFFFGCFHRHQTKQHLFVSASGTHEEDLVGHFTCIQRHSTGRGGQKKSLSFVPFLAGLGCWLPVQTGSLSNYCGVSCRLGAFRTLPQPPTPPLPMQQ